jgi:hypothetical protein
MATSTQHTIRGTRDWLQCLAMRVKMMLMMTLIFVKCQWNKTFQYTYLLISVKAVFLSMQMGLDWKYFFVRKHVYRQLYFLNREYIRCKSISPCKLCKLQYGPSDQHPRGGVQRGGREDLQKCDYSIQGRVQIVKLLNPLYPLDDDLIIQIEVFIVCMKRLVCIRYVAIMIIEQ